MLYFVISVAVLLIISAFALYARHFFKDHRGEALTECGEIWKKIEKEAQGTGSIQALAQVDRINTLCVQFSIKPTEFGAQSLKQIARDAEVAFCKWPGSKRFLNSPELAEFRMKYLASSTQLVVA